MNLPRNRLYERAIWGLNRQFEDHKGRKYEIMKFLWAQTIFDDPCRGVRCKGWPQDWKDLPDSKSLFKQLPGIGIVIGNLTSQLLSNIYLDLLDRYIIFDLGWKHYGRYVDDFYIVVTEDELSRVLEDVRAIRNYLARLGLVLHPRKIYVQPVEHGVPFLGAVIYPGRIHPGQRLVKNTRRAFHETVEGVRDVESTISYIGHMKYMAHDKLLTKLFNEVGWEYRV